MKINLWYSENMEEWRWTLCDGYSSTTTMESGGQKRLSHAMDDIYKTVKYIRNKKNLTTN